MTPLPALSDVIRETLTDDLLQETVARDCSETFLERTRDRLLDALLLPLTEREQGLREERDKAVSALARVQSAAKTIVAGADRRVLSATAHEPAARVAIATLDSERAMNATLTSELEAAEARVSALTAENATLEREIDKQNDEGQALVDERRTLLDQVARLTAQREELQAAIRKLPRPISPNPMAWDRKDLSCDWCGVTWTVESDGRIGEYDLDAVHPENDCLWSKVQAGAPHAPTQEKAEKDAEASTGQSASGGNILAE